MADATVTCRTAIIPLPAGTQIWVVWRGESDAYEIDGPFPAVAIAQSVADVSIATDMHVSHNVFASATWDNPALSLACCEELVAGHMASELECGMRRVLVLFPDFAGEPWYEGKDVFFGVDAAAEEARRRNVTRP